MTVQTHRHWNSDGSHRWHSHDGGDVDHDHDLPGTADDGRATWWDLLRALWVDVAEVVDPRSTELEGLDDKLLTVVVFRDLAKRFMALASEIEGRTPFAGRHEIPGAGAWEPHAEVRNTGWRNDELLPLAVKKMAEKALDGLIAADKIGQATENLVAALPFSPSWRKGGKADKGEKPGLRDYGIDPADWSNEELTGRTLYEFKGDVETVVHYLGFDRPAS